MIDTHFVDDTGESKTFLFSYRFQDAQWSFDLHAASAEEAKERLKALAFAKLDGELKARIAIAPTIGQRLGRFLGLW